MAGKFTHRGRTQTLAAWCREMGLIRRTVEERLRRGWELFRALETKPDAFYSSCATRGVAKWRREGRI